MTQFMASAAPVPQARRDRGRQVLVLALAAAQVGAIVWQVQASTAGADLYARASDPPVVPAGYTFAIWGPIYLGSFAYAAYQALPGQAARALHRRVGPWAAAAFGASALWALAAGFPPPLVTWGTVVMIFVMFGTLFVGLVRAVALAQTVRDRWLVVTPLGLYAGYVTLATVANTAATLGQQGVRTPLGLGETTWAALMLGVAGGLAGVVLRRAAQSGRVPVAYAAAAVWGLGGVVVQNVAATSQPVVAAAAGLAAVWVGATAWRLRRRGAPGA